MAGVNFTFDTSDYQVVVDALARWARGAGMAALNRAMAAEVESQVRRRIEDERTSPEGNPWADWSPGYAATRHGGHRLLQNEGDLLDSINALATADRAEVGTNLVYGAVHQFGFAAKNIPARPYLGLSSENAEDVMDVVETWVNQQMRQIRRG